MLVYKGIYHWCCLNNVRYVYMVVEDIMYRMLRAKGFHGYPVGDALTMPDGCVAITAVINWKEYIRPTARSGLSSRNGSVNTDEAIMKSHGNGLSSTHSPELSHGALQMKFHRVTADR